MKKKLGMKICSISLVLVMVVSLFSGMFTFSASAAAPAATIDPDTVTSYSVWDGSSTDQDWESAGDNAYYISSASELAGLAAKVNASSANKYSGYTFYITAHIDLDGHEWTPIGKYNGGGLTFGGSLIGAYGKTEGSDVVIKNMKITNAPQVNYGLVGSYIGSEISSITLLDPVVSGTKNTAGFFVGYGKDNAKTFSDLAVVNGTMDISGASDASYVGGIAAYTNGINVTFLNCSVDAKIDVSGHKYVGGFIGYANGKTTFDGCSSFADITSTNQHVGGFVGYQNGATEYTDCLYYGTINVGKVTQVAGFVGMLINGTSSFTGCYSGAIIKSNERRVGGFVGELGNASASTKVTFERCQFDGLVGTTQTQGGAYVGRLQAGKTAGNNSLTFNNCVNTGASINSLSVSDGGASWIGLVAGDSDAATYLNLTFNSGNCFSAIDAGMAAKNDPLTLTVTVSNASLSIANKTVNCSSSAKAFDSYDNPTLLSAVSNMGSTFTTANGWTINSAGMPILTIAANIDNPYTDADLTWLSMVSPVAADDASPIPSIAVTVDTTEEYIGLAKLSNLYNFPLGMYEFTIDWTNIDTLLATDDIFADGFDLVLNERATYTCTVGASKLDYDVFSVALQTRAGDADGYYDVRFISSVNTLDDYTKVGFEIIRNDSGATLTLSTTKVYTSIKGANVAYTPADTFADESTYFYAVIVDNIPQDMSITVRAFADLTDGTRVYGKAQKGTVGASSSATTTALNAVAAEYQIVYGEGNAATRKVAIALRDRIETLTGVYMPVVTDTAANANTSVVKDILVGATSRIEADERELGYYDMMICCPETSKIFIAGGSDVAYKQAYMHLVDMLQNASTLDGVSWSKYASGNAAWATNTLTSGAENYLSSFTPVWADESWSYTANYKNSWISDFHEKTAAVLEGGRIMSKAHRGDLANYPDGSLEGIASAILVGADAVEFDIRMTLDGIPVVMHNQTLSATTNAESFVGTEGYPTSLYVSDWTYVQLKSLNLTTDKDATVTAYKIPTLYEVLLLCADRVFVQIDAKDRILTGGSVGIINDSETVYNIATAAKARETLMHFYYDEYVYDSDNSDYTVNDSTYNGAYKNWINTYGLEDSESYDDQCFVKYVQWCEELGTDSIGQSMWPEDSDGNRDNESAWNGELNKLVAVSKKRPYWTEDPYNLCKWIQSNYSGVSYTAPSYPQNTEDPAEDITPVGSNLTVWTYGTGDVQDWATLFSSN